MELFIQQLFNGLTTGSIYVLVALGLTMVYGVMEIPNFAHGGLYMLAAYFTLVLSVFSGLNYWLSLLLSAMGLVVIGVAVERLVYNPLRNGPHINYFIAAIGLFYLLDGLALIIWGPEYWQLPVSYDRVISIFGLTLTVQRLVVIFTTVLLLVGLNLFMKKTLVGATIEAMSQDREGAFLVGINADKVAMLTFGISMVLAAMAASLAAPLHLVYPSMGHLVILKAFVILVLGGMGSMPGAIVGGYILGLAESMGATYISMNYKDLVAFAILVIILSIKPTGLFSREVT
ncbi:ABC transporter permease [Clostridiales bacterium PH28_bin88]|nr:ABC transporter permease [Clostridiales bacterium PH28_bin88]